MKSHRHAGQVNLRGKRVKLLSCRCCSVIDLRPKAEAIVARREMREG